MNLAQSALIEVLESERQWSTFGVKDSTFVVTVSWEQKGHTRDAADVIVRQDCACDGAQPGRTNSFFAGSLKGDRRVGNQSRYCEFV